MTPALEGDLAHFTPSEVLQLLQLAQANGRLEIVRPGERVDIEIECGRPVFARTSGRSVRVGEVLVHHGGVPRAAVDAALARQRSQPRRPLGALLVEAGVASPDTARDAVLEVLRRILWGMLLWGEGRFRFVPGEPAAPAELPLDVDLEPLILDGLRLADETRLAAGTA